MSSLKFVFLSWCLFTSNTVCGSVWHVERDGTGDFSVIQDAVDAAESGDTIQIGAGHFIETSNNDYNGQIIQVCIVLEKSLIIIGSGQSETIIGPDSRTKTEYDTAGIVSRSDNLNLLIKDLSFVDCEGHSVFFAMENGGQLQIENVQVENSYTGVFIKNTINSHIRECSFSSVVGDGIFILNGQNTEISNSQIQTPHGAGINIQWPASSGISIENCEINGGVVGVFLADCGSVSISNCNISNVLNNGLSINSSDGVRINNVVVTENIGIGIGLSGNNDLIVQNSIFKGSYASVMVMYQEPEMVFQNNHILQPDDGWWVYVTSHYSGTAMDLDFTQNYWGTTDPDEISLGIYDGHDDDSRDIFIVFEPMADGPVSTQATTFDGLKAMFR